MDTKVTSGEAARMLGTSVARVLRAVPSLDAPPARTPGGHVRLTLAQVDELRTSLGAVPVTAGRTRVELLVLAALLKRPIGLRSARAVAVAAGVSPTAASMVLRALDDEGLVVARPRTLVEGRPRSTATWEVCRESPALQELRPILRRTSTPRGVRPGVRRATVLPTRLRHNVWNVDRRTLAGPLDTTFLAGRLLASDDPQSLAWLVRHVDGASIARAASMRGVSEARRAFAAAVAG